MKRYLNILTLVIPTAIVLLSACNSDVINNDTPFAPQEGNIIHIGGLQTDEPELVITQTRADEPDRQKAETVEWLKGALLNGLDITYSNMTNDVHNKENERVAILKWTGTRNEDKDIGIYTFNYKDDANTKATWYDNGKHYFEGQYVPEEIRVKAAYGETPSAQNLTTDQHDDSDYTYTIAEDGTESHTGTIGNYTLLSHYIGMPPNWTTSATIEQVLLPFKHRLARVIAYVLIDEELKATLEGYTVKSVDAEGKITAKDDPKTTSFSFGNVQVLEKVTEADITIHNAQTASLTPKWKTARKVIPHFYDEFNQSLNEKKELVAQDEDAQNYFIVYTYERDNKKIHPREKVDWMKAHKAYRKSAGLEENSTVAVAEDKIANAEKSGYTRQLYTRVPIYDIIVRPTYKSKEMVMYDEEGYYNADKTPNDDNIKNLAEQTNSIEFEMTLSTGLIYKKKFEFDLNANQQTVVYLTVDREGIDYDDSASELWIANNHTDGYYGIDNQLGHNLSKAGSSWQRAVRYGSAQVNNVTDGNFYQDETEGDVSGQYFNTPSKWIEEFAKAYKGGARHGDYFVLDKDITIDATKLPDNFVFTGHLDGRGHTITLTGLNTEWNEDNYIYKETTEYSTTSLHIKDGDNYVPFTLPNELYSANYYTSEEIEAEKEKDQNFNKTTSDIKDYSPASPSIADFMNGTYYIKTNEEYTICVKPDKLYAYVNEPIPHKSGSSLFAGLNAIYRTAQEDSPSMTTPWEANVHKEYNSDSKKYFWVPEIGYRAEILNVKLKGGTFFPEGAVFTGTDFNKVGATVSGYIFNCWEIDKTDETKKKEITNEVPIPTITPIP